MKNIFAGDSLTDPVTLGTYGLVYPALFSCWRLEGAINIAKAGSCAADQALAIYLNPPEVGDRCFLMLGTNDLGPVANSGRGYGAAALSLYSTTMLSYLYFMGGNIRTARDAAWSYTGTWGDNASIGKYSNTAGSTAAVQFSGDVFAMSHLLVDGIAGSFSLAIDGVNKGTFSPVPPATINTWYAHQSWAPSLIRIAGCGAGDHTAVLTLVSGYVLPDFIWLGPSGVSAYGLTIPRMRAPAVGTDAGVAAYNSALAGAIATASGDGIVAALIDTFAAIDPASPDLVLDGIHPTNQGHLKLHAALRAVIG